MNYRKTVFHLMLFFVSCSTVAFSAPVSAPSTYTRSMLGTVVEITIAGEDAKTSRQVSDMAFDEIDRVEQLMSSWLPDSDVGRVNRSAGKGPVVVSKEVFDLIDSAVQIYRLTGGAFDITIGNVLKLWNFLDGSKKLPDSTVLKQSLKLVGSDRIVLNREKKSVFLKTPGMRMDLGGIAKGYAVDMAMKVIMSNGVSNAIVKAGGDTRVEGMKNGAEWSIGIQDPRDTNKVVGRLNLSSRSISTSGDYERYFILDGIRYHHIINPETGYPATGLRSATIISQNTTWTDALATSVMVLGEVKGLALIEKMPRTEAMVINAKGKIIRSSGL